MAHLLRDDNGENRKGGKNDLLSPTATGDRVNKQSRQGGATSSTQTQQPGAAAAGEVNEGDAAVDEGEAKNKEKDKAAGADKKDGKKDNRKDKDKAAGNGSARAGKKAGAVDQDLANLLVKAQLRSQQQIRTLEGALYDVIIIKTETLCIQRATRQITLYNEKVKQEGENHECGPPHIWVWGGLVQGLLDATDEIGPQHTENLRAHLDSWQLLNLTEKLDLIKICSVEKTYHGHLKRLILLINGGGALRAVTLLALEKLGGVRKLGRAPRGAMERALGEYARASASSTS